MAKVYFRGRSGLRFESVSNWLICMSSIQNLQQLREFLTVYNTLTERCFSSCIRDYNSNVLNKDEEGCVSKCIEKQMLVNRRFMIVFAEQAPKVLFKQGQESPKLTNNKMNVISEHGFRQDGRRSSQIRNINTRLGLNKSAEGSSYIEHGNTKVLCAVYGPYEGKASRRVEDRCVINCQYSMTTFSGLERKKRPRGDRKSTEMARLLEKAFESVVITESFPRSQIDIFCEVIQSDGSNLAACVNAASLALADAGIPMKGLASAVTCGVIEGNPVVDLASREENDLMPRITLATICGRDEVVLVELQNRLHVDHLPTVMETAKATCADVYECLQVVVQQHLRACAPIVGN
ncbi:unnamed protein product [Caenorhabditis auriculariae]|uniref:Putative exosome complex component RRP41 n=1 Tax=Caenorhabditis auriculariae TaxID=2777116 RepID=A0A8S1HHU0_9PELO|nr:unnamed protein product [Caenorhabditis auriculariae]